MHNIDPVSFLFSFSFFFTVIHKIIKNMFVVLSKLDSNLRILQ